MSVPQSDELLVAYVERWHGIVPPNDFARRAVADLAKVMADLERVRGRLRFEDEPSGFETALLEASGLPRSEWGA